MTRTATLSTGRTLTGAAILGTALLLAALLHSPAAGAGQSDADAAPGPTSPVVLLTLDEARSLALANNEQVQRMTEAVAAADADAMGARSGKLPHLDLVGSWDRNFKKPAFFLPADMVSPGGPTSVEMGGDYDLEGAITLSLNLWTAGRLSASAGAADESLAATRWQKALVQDAVLYDVDEAYFDVLLAEARVAITESAVEAAEEALRVTGAAHEQGTASRFDLLRAEVELANRQTPLIQSRNLRDLAVMRLLRTCGLAPATAVALADSLGPVAVPEDLELLLQEMRDGSAELRSLRHQIAAREQVVRLSKAGRGPVLQLQGAYAVQGQWDDDLTPGSDETATSASAGLALAIPIFDGLAAKSDIGRSEAELRSTSVELERVTRNRELGVRQSRIYVVNALAALEGRTESVTLAEEAHRLALVRLENGLATPLERLDAEMALIDARTQLAEILHTCNVARSALTLAVGTHTVPVDGAQEIHQSEVQ